MRPTSRWLVPVAVAATIVGGTAVSSAVAGSTPTLPQRSPEQVLAAVAGCTVTTLSGTVATHADLGLPGLPSGMGGQGRTSTSSPQALFTRFLTGDNTVRVWLDGPQRERAQLIDPFADLDVVRNGSDLWAYDSRTDTARHAVLSAHPNGTNSTGGTKTPSTRGEQGGVPESLRNLTPDQLAKRVLTAVDPTTSVTLEQPADVAGQDTYTLRIAPKTDRTLVDHVLIAVDAANGAPLQVTVYARGHANPVLRSGFTSVDFSRPAASVFSFTPPRSATVKQVSLPSGALPSGALPSGTMHPGTSGTAPEKDVPGTSSASGPSGPSSGSAGDTVRPTVIGSGWTTIIELAGSPSSNSSPGTLVADPKTASLLRQLTTPVSGGRALRTALVSVLLTDDGRVLAGAVPLQALQDAAARR